MLINSVWVPTAPAILCQFGGRLVWCCRLCYRADKGDWTDVLFDEVANSLWTAQYHLSRWGVVWPVLLREARLLAFARQAIDAECMGCGQFDERIQAAMGA